MKAIWKFPLEITDEHTVRMPKGFEILCVQEQFNLLCLWALVDPDAGSLPVTILVRGTGHLIDGDLGRYVGTAQTSKGYLVWHVFVKEDV